jgi:hypothetical protein
MSDWRVPTDPAYASLVRALRRRAEDLARASGGGTIADIYFVKDCNNTAWCLLRLENADVTQFLIWGQTTVGFRDLVDGDVGVEVKDVPWDEKLLPVMDLLAKREDAYFRFCRECGHQTEFRVLSGTRGKLDADICPACGRSGANPDSLKSP